MSYNPFTLEGKTILITGASSGIGRASAIECSRMGAKVILTARNEERLHDTLSAMEGTDHQYIVADISEEEGIKKLVSQLPAIDGLVHCAGISQLKPIQVLRNEDLQGIFSTNYFSPVLLTKTLVQKKKLSSSSSLVYISSISGNGNTAVGLSGYGTSKSALMTFIEYAALELASKHIRCNAILPGRINTPLLLNMAEEDLQKDIEKYPLKRYGEAQEVAQAAVYLLSDAAKWITGTSIKIDGGRTLN